MQPDRLRDPFFIIGTGRCGTTLLQSMLNAHRGLYIPPETHFFFKVDPVVFGFEDPVPDQDVQSYIERVTGSEWWSRLSFHSPKYTENFSAAVVGGCGSTADLFAWVLNSLTPPEFSARRLGEKSPHHEKYVDRILEQFPNARFIHLRRDPRDVTEALLRMPWWPDRSTYRTAVFWTRVHDRAERDLTRLGPEKYLIVRYESLVQDPRQSMETVCDFLGEPFHESTLTHNQSPQPTLHPVELSYKAESHQPISMAHVHKYRDRLTHKQVRVIERAVGSRLTQSGYTPDESVRRLPGQRVLAKLDRMLWKLTGR